MYIEHLRQEFYEVLCRANSRILILTAVDIDSVCTCKILQYLFQIDHVQYTLVSVEGIDELKDQFQRFASQCKYVVLINCGGTIDILNLFDNPEHSVIFILDSHRPTHILNVYNESQQVRLVIPYGEEEGIPAVDDIFRNDDLDDEDDESDVESHDGYDDEYGEGEEGQENEEGGRSKTRKRKRLETSNIERKRKRKEISVWEDNRREILFKYTQYNYFGAPASLIMLEVAWTMSRGNVELCWYAIVGLTDYYVLGKMERGNYILLAHQLQNHITRLNNAQQNQRDFTKVLFENDICLYLYRHWTCYDSMKMTPYVACKFKTWLGDKRIQEFLAEVGLPLAQVHQKFSGMDLHFRKPLKEILLRKAEKYGLNDITIPTFTRQVGLKKKYSAIDCHLAALSVLEAPGRHINTSKKFMAALDILTPDKSAELQMGVENAKKLMMAIYKQVQTFMETKSVTPTGNILIANVLENGLDTVHFGSPNTLTLLAHFTLRATAEVARSRRIRDFPLIMLAPQTQDLYLLVGVPPLSEDCSSNLFGKAFEKVAERLEEGVALDFFDANIVQLHARDRTKFIDKLLELLE